MFSLELSFPLKKLFIINKNKHNSNAYHYLVYQLRGGSRAAATSKMECFVIIVHGFQPKAVTIITKHSILDAAATLDPPLLLNTFRQMRDEAHLTLGTQTTFKLQKPHCKNF